MFLTATRSYDCSFSDSFLSNQLPFRRQDVFNILNIECAVELLWFDHITCLHELIIIFTRLSLGVQRKGAFRRFIGPSLPKLGFWRPDCSLHVWGDLLKQTTTLLVERVFLNHYVKVILIWCWDEQTIWNPISAQILWAFAPWRL